MAATSWADLVLDTGELVRVEYPSRIEDDFWETVENMLKRREWLSFSRWDGCHATFMGLRMERVNMARVVGTL